MRQDPHPLSSEQCLQQGLGARLLSLGTPAGTLRCRSPSPAWDLPWKACPNIPPSLLLNHQKQLCFLYCSLSGAAKATRVDFPWGWQAKGALKCSGLCPGGESESHGL